MNKKGNILGIIMVLAVLGIATLLTLYFTGVISPPSAQQVVTTQTAQQVAQATQEGDVAQIKVYVRDIENNDKNTKISVPVYCQDDTGNFVIDSSVSSTTTEITGTTTRGKTITCWAFNDTYQSTPVTVIVDEEAEHILIDGMTMATNGRAKLQFYDDTLTTGEHDINISVGEDATDTFQKMKFTINGSDNAYWLGGFYFDTVTNTNVSVIDIAGSASLGSMDKSSSMIVLSSLDSKVSARKELWDFAFEVDDDASTAGNQPLLMHENDYLESGTVAVTADGGGCEGDADLITTYAFQKGYYKSSIENSVKFGHETDATSPSRIGGSIGDITGEGFYCI